MYDLLECYIAYKPFDVDSMTEPTTAARADREVIEDPCLPDEDLALFKGLKPAQTRKVALQRVEEYEAEIVQLRQYIRDLYFFHNAALPIHTTLSTDLITEIYRRVRPTTRWDIRVTHVCRTWRYAALSASEFWAGLPGIRPSWGGYSIEGGTRHREFLTALIKRSAPLNFDLYVKGPDILSIHPTLEEHSSRLISIFVTVDDRHVDTLRPLVLLNMPNLHTMTLGVPHRRDKDGAFSERLRIELPLLPHMSDRFPRLHTLHIHGALVSPALFASSLRTLHMKGCGEYYHSSYDEPCSSGRILSIDILLDALRKCPLLEELKVEKATIPHDLVATPGRSLPRLPNLRRCTIDDDNPQFIRTFLAHVEMPSTVALQVQHKSSPLSRLLPDTPVALVSAVTGLDVAIERPRPLLFARHMAPCCVTITGSEGRLSLATSYQHWSNDATAQPPRSIVLREIVQKFAPSPALRELTLRLDTRLVVVQADWDFALEAFPELTKLVVHIDTCRRLVRTLRRPHVCPHLETIAIHCSDGKGVHENVVSMAEFRVAKGTSLRRFEYHQKPRGDPEGRLLPQTGEMTTPLSLKRIARLRAFIPEVVLTPDPNDP